MEATTGIHRAVSGDMYSEEYLEFVFLEVCFCLVVVLRTVQNLTYGAHTPLWPCLSDEVKDMSVLQQSTIPEL